MIQSRAGAVEPLSAPPARLPADYYSSSPDDVRPVFPRWVPLGCGGVSAVVLVLLFIGGAMAGRGDISAVFDWVFSQVRHELTGLYTRDVTVAQKSALDAQLAQLKQNVDAHKVKPDQLLPLLRAMSEATSDQSVTPAEVDKLTAQARELNAHAQPPARNTR
jgi:hypothetical protein